MSRRQREIVERLDIQPDNRVLEIGCGQGVAVSYICEKLDSGRVTAIDRSEKMIIAAKRRNAEYVESGKIEFIVADLESADFGDRRFDKILAVRVGLFHREPERARRIVEKWLAPGGEVTIVFDPANSGKVSKTSMKEASK